MTETYIMIWASSINSSDDMQPSFTILMATWCLPFHMPSWTTPNWPLPSSFTRHTSSRLSSHAPMNHTHTRIKLIRNMYCKTHIPDRTRTRLPRLEQYVQTVVWLSNTTCSSFSNWEDNTVNA